MLASFYEWERYLLLFYGSDRTTCQVLFDKTDGSYRVTDQLTNDLLPDGKIAVSRHHLDRRTLAIELSAEEEDYDLHFQLLHIKR